MRALGALQPSRVIKTKGQANGCRLGVSRDHHLELSGTTGAWPQPESRCAEHEATNEPSGYYATVGWRAGAHSRGRSKV